jgi:chromosome segregation ATPase
MNAQWDGKVVVSTPGGQLIEMSLGDYVARKNAEIERLRAENERLTRQRDKAYVEVEQLTRQRDEARAEVQNMRLRAESDEALIDAARAHRNNLRAEIERTHALLKDPDAVAINMLRGVIALPSADQIRHIYQQALEGES